MDQPRKSFNESSMEELAASIGTHGVVQPLVVRSLQDSVFEIIAGERRWRAAQMAGLTRVPALVRETREHQALELALVENVQREDLNPVDQARAYQRLLSEFNLTQEQVAERVGKSRTSVANMIRLLNLPGEALEWLREETPDRWTRESAAFLAGPGSDFEGGPRDDPRQVFGSPGGSPCRPSRKKACRQKRGSCGRGPERAGRDRCA